jgi:hypothetical protein
MRTQPAINPAKVVHETVNGETILIQLETGTYYSLTGAGAEVWALVDAGRPREQIAVELAERHGRPLDDVEPAVTAFLQELLEEDVIEPSVSGPSGNGSPTWRADSWQPPEVEKFTDMQDFIAMYGVSLEYTPDHLDPADRPSSPDRVREPVAGGVLSRGSAPAVSA